MNNFKVYQKRGAVNYKEKKMITALEKELSSRFEKNPDLASTFRPAKNIDELKELYEQYCIEDVAFEESGDKTPEQQHKEFRESLQEDVKPIVEEKTASETQTDSTFLDPFNDAEPIVRDYVMEDKKISTEEDNQTTKQTTFEEPLDDKMAFELPNMDDEKGNSKRSSQQKQKTDSKPINPSFDTMDNGKKKRSTKRFAKMIIEATCILAEKGCIWWTTKDITEDKLAKYEMDGEMDLQILLTLENNQQATVRQWFGQKVGEAQTIFKVTEEDKNDLIDSLYEVMLEKGIAPTPMQELIINSVKTFVIDMGVKAMMFNNQIKGVLEQLRQLKREENEQNVSNLSEEDTGEVVESPAVAETQVEQTQ
jgi:hypothetical protein